MKNVFKSLIAAVVVLASVVPALAVSESAVLFLQISPGARAAGMGEAFVALADDATAVYYNPAGLGFQRGKEITLMHTNWLPQLGTDLFYEFGAYRHHFENIGTIGINVTYLNLGTQSRTDESGPDPIGEFSSNEYAVSLTYGTQLSEKWAVGLGARFIQSNLSPFGAGSEEGDGRASAFGFDLATLYKVSSRFSVGANLSNMGPKITYIDAAQADPLPTNLRVGFAAHAINNKYNKLTFVADVNKTMVKRYSDGTSDPFYKAIFTSPWFEEKKTISEKDTTTENVFKGIVSGGAEYWYNDLFALRAGYYWDQDGKVDYFSLGAGIAYNLYRFDFSYVSADEGHPLANTMRFSLSIGF
ncbi:MAG TPA: PorV/PorQ family protein [bacterium]|nr:PorV/PorQ family protein [bacterium]HPG82239.1 PorV/PorQ family protein [bacterium]HPM58507.1 PorV/PorQ family protein [bacterium]